MKKILCVVCSLSCLAGIANSEDLINEYSMPREYWGYMLGYKYDYKKPQCSVKWNEREALLIYSGKGCSDISAEQMRADAIKSIIYIQKQGDYSDFEHYYLSLEEVKKKQYTSGMALRDAQFIWLTGCNDYKKGLSLGDFSHANDVGKMMQTYTGIKERIVISLYSDGWNIAKFNKGFVNCSNSAPYRVNDFVSGVNIMR